MDRTRACALAALTLLLGACGANDTGGTLGGDGGTPRLRPGATTAPAGATILTAELSGSEEVPGPGAAGGAGTARLVLTTDGKVCAELATTRVDGATAAHVHTGPKGVAGPVVITLTTPKDGRASGCVPADPAVVAMLAADPASAYVNVHTAALAAGAVRGQLGPG